MKQQVKPSVRRHFVSVNVFDFQRREIYFKVWNGIKNLMMALVLKYKKIIQEEVYV